MNEVDNILEHYGVKGMHWGVITKPRSKAPKEPTPIIVKAPLGKPVRAKGGKNLPASEDAIAAAVAKQKVRANNGTQVLTTKEMQALVTRMNLEQQYSKLNPKQKNAGLKFAEAALATPVPGVALEFAKERLKDTSDYRVKTGLMVAEAIVNNSSNNGKKKKK